MLTAVVVMVKLKDKEGVKQRMRYQCNSVMRQVTMTGLIRTGYRWPDSEWVRSSVSSEESALICMDVDAENDHVIRSPIGSHGGPPAETMV